MGFKDEWKRTRLAYEHQVYLCLVILVTAEHHECDDIFAPHMIKPSFRWHFCEKHLPLLNKLIHNVY